MPAPPVRARLWLQGRWLGDQDEEARLWLHLNDGRVLAFRLPGDRFEDDRLIPPLVRQIADDLRGLTTQIQLPDGTYAVPLYAAPAAVLPQLSWGNPRHEAARDFAAGLDQGILKLLASFNRHRVFDSVRNYNRLLTLEPQRQERRIQALTRFPVLVVPILLTAHHRLETFGGKRHAWRDHDDVVLEAIDRGRDLSGALARHYGISRSLVRAPVCRYMWGDTALAHTRLLKLLDGIPAHRRPTHPDVFERALPLLFHLNHLSDDNESLRRLGATAFKAGLEAMLDTLETRFTPLNHHLADSRDFCCAALATAVDTVPASRRLSPERLALLWMERRGIASLLAASRRWHQRVYLPAKQRGTKQRLPTVFGQGEFQGMQIRELTTFSDFVHEGEEMHHCVATYWEVCLAGSSRIFALERNGCRGTAEYAFETQPQETAGRFYLKQLRGPGNARVEAGLERAAHEFVHVLNGPECAAARRQLLQWRSQWRSLPHDRQQCLPLLDQRSQRELQTVLAYFCREHLPTLGGEMLRDFVAGYQYHQGELVESELAVGAPLSLIREPHNPHDPLAVRIEWQGKKLGYVPRPKNATIARSLDTGEQLTCRIASLDKTAPPWHRLEFVIVAQSRYISTEIGPTERKSLIGNDAL